MLFDGDCLEVLKGIPDGSVDAVVADPPYGVLNRAKAKWDNIIPFEPLWKELKRVRKDTTPIIMFCQEPFTSFMVQSNLTEFKYKLYWQKTHPSGFLNSKKQPMRCIEEMCVFYKKQPTYNVLKTTGHKPAHYAHSSAELMSSGGCYGGGIGEVTYKGGNTDRFPTHLMTYALDVQRSYLHPTQKPLALIEHILKMYTNEGDTVLDFCMGSGTTGVACKNLGREFIGIEKDEKYFEVARERIEKCN